MPPAWLRKGQWLQGTGDTGRETEEREDMLKAVFRKVEETRLETHSWEEGLHARGGTSEGLWLWATHAGAGTFLKNHGHG